MARSPLSVLTAPIRLALFDVRVTGPLLVALIYYPDRLRSILPAAAHHLIDNPTVIKVLKVALALNIVLKVNNKLSQYMSNNWKGNAKFVKSQELVLISGGSSGIGKSMAEQFAKTGVKVVILDLAPPKTALPPNIYYYRGDVTSSSEITSVAAEIRRDHGHPTVLINNAGIGSGLTILGGSEDLTRKTFEVNTISHFTMVREFVPDMVKKNHGHIVTLASMASFVCIAQNVDYSCTKVSALAFHEGLHSELKARHNAPEVKTSIVHPYWIRTPLIETLTSNPKFKEVVLEPEDVAAAVVEQVMNGKSGQLILPSGMSGASTIRGWPTWMQLLVRNRAAKGLEGIESL